MENKRFMTVYDVSEYLDVSVPMACKVIRRLNDELIAQGCLTVAGRVSRTCFEHKICGGLGA